MRRENIKEVIYLKVKISADSTCDLSPELLEKYDIKIVPLYIVKEGESFKDGIEICPDDIYRHVAAGGSLCSTAAVPVADYEEFFAKELESCDEIVHFHISSDMSACYQNAQVLNLLNDLKKKRNFTYLFIAHDLSVVRFISDRIAVIHKGRIVELAEAEELFAHPLHPYTKALLSAVPYPDPKIERSKKLFVYDPSVHNYTTDKPSWTEISKDHYVWANERELDSYRTQLLKSN